MHWNELGWGYVGELFQDDVLRENFVKEMASRGVTIPPESVVIERTMEGGNVPVIVLKYSYKLPEPLKILSMTFHVPPEPGDPWRP
jgi:hypothetical protein